MDISSQPWGFADEEKEVELFTLMDEIIVKVCNYGGTVVSVLAPDSSGELGEVVLGYSDLSGYLSDRFYLGSTVGRYANRIGGASLEIDGKRYKLAKNDGENHLHGGVKGFDKVVWDAKVEDGKLEFSYVSPHMEEGYPGELTVKVVFNVYGDSLEIDYYAKTDQSTTVNLTNHSYFNLAGEGSILDHHLWIDADQYTSISESLIPLGDFDDVEGTPFDFRDLQRIGGRINEEHVQLKRGGGYDHNYALNQVTNPQVRVTEPGSGRTLEISTTMPGVQLYSGNFLDGTVTGRRGTIERRSGLCLETQYFPDSPNQPGYPSTLLRQGEKYIEKTVYRFTTVS